MAWGRVVCAVAVLLSATACAVLDEDDEAYGAELVRFDGDQGESNRYVDLDDGRAQLSIGSPDGHEIVVQWRDPDGSGWTEPETVWEDEKNTAIDNTVRYGGGTVGIIQTYTPDVHNDSDADDVHIGIVCSDRSCDVGPSPGYAGEAQVTPDGGFAYLGQNERGVTLWTRDRGIHRAAWSGHPGFEYGVVSASAPLLAPDGSLRVVGSRPARGACTFDLYAARPGTADLERVGRSTEPVRGRSDCSTYLDTFSSDWVAVRPNDHRAREFWFVREGDRWTTTGRDQSGLRLVDVDRGCCDTFLTEFVHWNSVAYASPDGRRVQVQSHLLGDKSWSEPRVLDGAPPGATCTWLEGHEVGDAGFAVLLVCHSGKVRDDFVGDAYAVAASPDLRTWESTYVTDVREIPTVEDDRLRVGDTTWAPDEGFVTNPPG